MNKKLLTSLLLVGLLAGCGEKGSSSSSVEEFYAPSSSSTVENSSSTTSSDSSSAAGPEEVVIPDYGLTTAPETGFALLITQADSSQYYVSLVSVDEFEGFVQYFGDDLTFNVGDVIKLYNGDAKEEWVEDTLNPAGQAANFEVTSDGIKCNVSGVYDVYVKIKYQLDEIYIGNQDGQ